MDPRRQLLHTLRRLAACRSGAALVEWTLVLPFLLTLGLGFMEFGHALYQYQQIANGVRDAARYLSRLDDPAASEAQAQNLATTGTIDGSGALRVPYWQPGDVHADVTEVTNTVDPVTGTSAYRGGATIRIVEVRTEVDYGAIGFLGFLGLGPIRFTLTHEERVIGE